MCVLLYIWLIRIGLCCQMLVFLISCSFSFIIFCPFWDSEMRLLSLSFWKNLSLFTFSKSTRYSLLGATLSFLTSRMSAASARKSTEKIKNGAEPPPEMSVLDLPDLVLECILEKLPAEGLCRMASVCSSLRDRCVSDHLWEKHMKNKWGRVIGAAAFKEWQSCVDSRKAPPFLNHAKQKGLMAHLIALIRSGFSSSKKNNRCFSHIDSVMCRYLALESGDFWFPAQVYNRENGHVGFMLSCYDAMLSYDRRTNTFNARYPPHGTRACAVESGVTWDRLRAPMVETSPRHLHISDCLNELHPGDQIEIQWRRNKEFPYGWWYGVVGHLETCDGSANYCRCHTSESVVLEFKQYAVGSRWRRTIVSRKEHREEGNEGDGFYGGIRKVCGEEEMSMWAKLWPAHALLE